MTGYGLLTRGRVTTAVLLTAFAVLPPVAEAFDLGYLTVVASRVMIYAIAALSLDLILGYGAMVSFGHAAFIGIGAYAVGMSAEHDLWEGALTFPIAMGAAGLFALATGAISLRTRGVYFIMITLAFGQMAYYTASSLSAYGGDDGLTIWGRSELLGVPVLEDDGSFYFFVLACLALCWWFASRVVASRFGRVLTGVRENRARMAAVGFDPYTHQLTAYVIAGMMAGLAGGLLANHAEFVSPAYMSWQRSGDLIIMVVLGGMGTLYGAVLGAVAYLALEDVLSGLTEHWRVIFGPLLILIVLFARGGIARAFRRESGGG
ncbi:MAG: branched-chain amino acid ABC transporter permease [Thalassobaculaceae bacterium]|nr:branched-chain amino acid ABC transporter permease [Thalassobaculaceae bacterium]